MTWFRVDDGLAFNGKTRRAGNAAMGLWVRAGAFVSQQLLDGFCPDDMAHALGNQKEVAALIGAGLWHRKQDVASCEACVAAGMADVAAKVNEEGYVFHEWSRWNPFRCEVEDRREKRAAAGKLGGQAKAANTKKSRS